MYDARVNLLTSQGPGTAMEFALKLIDLLLGKAKAAEMAAQLVLIPGMYDFRDQPFSVLRAKYKIPQIIEVD